MGLEKSVEKTTVKWNVRWVIEVQVFEESSIVEDMVK